MAGNGTSFAGFEKVSMATELGLFLQWVTTEPTMMDAKVNPHATMTIHSNRSISEPAETQYWNPWAEVF